MYSTLPHLRNTSDISGNSSCGSGGANKGGGHSYHYDNKVYERFEPLMSATQQAKYDKHKYEQQTIGGGGGGGNNLDNPPPVTMTTFGHKRSPSGESLGRNLHLAGAKLVLPTGEIPTLKPVDKNLIRPKLPPPGPPPTGGTANNSGKKTNKIY